MNRRREQGSTVEIVVIVILVAAVIGLVAWRILDSNKPQSQANTTTNTTTSNSQEPAKTTTTTPSTPTADANKGYIVIQDWGIRFKPTTSDQIQYTKAAPSRGDGYDFTTATAQKIDGCANASLWFIDRRKTKEEVMGALILNHGNKIGDYYYYYYHTQEMCAGDKAGQAVIEQQVNVVKTLLESIEAKQ